MPQGVKHVLLFLMKRCGFFFRVFDLYVDGFKHLTWGKALWVVIIVKLVIIFFVLKLFFFHDFIGEHAQKGHEDEFVSSKILKD